LTPADYPVALSKASPRLVREVGAERRVGKFTAGARDDSCFDRFQQLILHFSLEALNDPIRLLTLPHLANSVATRIPRLADASRVLIEGFLLELIRHGDLARLSTLSKDFEPYQAIFSPDHRKLIDDAINALEDRLQARETVSLDDSSRLLPQELSSRKQNLTILLGHLLHRGSATTDAAPGVGIDSVRLPHVAPRL
jgi:hypothetical protein